MSAKRLRHRLEHLAYRAALLALRPLSTATLRSVGHGLGRLVHRVDRKHRRLALDNLALALPELSDERRREITRRCFEHYGATFAEIATAGDRLDPDRVEAAFEVDGWEHVEAAEAIGRGYFFMAGHFGTWELATYLLGHRLGELHLVARPPNNPLVEREIRRQRERFGNHLVDKHGAGHRMLNVLRRKGRVGIVIDQRVRPKQGILVDFFGHPCWTSPVLAYLSILRRVPVLPIVCTPAPGGRYRLRIDPPITPEGLETGEESEAALTRRYLERVETDIRRQPELWLWMHRRWQLE